MEYPIEELEEIGLEHFEIINSNLNRNGHPIFESLKDYTLIQACGEQIGVMGIAFTGSNQTVSTILATIQKKSQELRTIGCQRVLCLLENPEGLFPYLSYKDFIESSEGVNWFFTSSTEKKSPEFLAVKNRDGNEVFIQVQPIQPAVIGVVHQDFDTQTFDFNIVNT
ncbi:hypothetical protein ACFOSV_11430 [Algoriphagus namhaensis]|uniref:Uncharacterized protein n=1 Tax=Algoriphagus namhaensis TaxID=915353 RepID=A0ABV8AS22_9BACT